MGKNLPRVLHLINTFSVGGVEMHLLSLVQRLPRDRYDVTVAYFREEAQEARSLVPDFQRLGVPVVDLGMPHWRDVWALARLRKVLKRGRFHLVHTHLFRADVFGPPLARMAGVPAVVTSVHNTERFFKNPAVRLALRLANRHVDRVVAISQAVKASLVDDVGLPEDRIQVIHYGIAMDREGQPSRVAIRDRLGVPQDALVIGTVGRLSRQKGHRYLLEAFPRVLGRWPDARLLIVGHDDERLRPELQALAQRLGIGERVLLPGYMEGAEAMEAMDLFALPSLWEGFGLVMLEAMRAGLPVVASRVGSLPEIVEEGETGLLVPPADSEGLASAVLRVLDTPERGRALGARGRERARRHFSLDGMVCETVGLYDTLLENGRPVGTLRPTA